MTHDPAGFRRVRLDAGLGLDEVARVAHLSIGTVSRYERGQRVLSATAERRLHQAIVVALAQRAAAASRMLAQLAAP